MTRPILELVRLEEDSRHGSFGVLKINKQVFCVTLEPPDLLNEKNRSSIPAQQYDCFRYRSPRYGETFQVMNVPGRDKILFHAGNVEGDTMGCILLAQHFGKLAGNRAVLNSGETFKAFMALLQDFTVCHLTIKEQY
jgi:hypothetical protein